jgi:hypothetical protein
LYLPSDASPATQIVAAGSLAKEASSRPVPPESATCYEWVRSL